MGILTHYIAVSIGAFIGIMAMAFLNAGKDDWK